MLIMGDDNEENGDDGDLDRGRWLIGKLLDPREDEFRDAVIYSQTVPISDEEIDAILEEFSERELAEFAHEIKAMAASVPDRIRSMNRRDFFKNTVKVAATGSLVADIAIWGRKGVGVVKPPVEENDTKRVPEYYENFWPNSLETFAQLDVEETEQLLRSSHVAWDTFVNRSTEMLSEVAPGDTVHIHGFFYRAYPREFFERLPEISRTAESVTVYLADPVNGHGDASAVELHQEREVLVHEYLLTRPVFREVLAEPEDIFSWSAVPHLAHLTLNSVRGLLHSLRFLETAHYFYSVHDDILFQPISVEDASPLRGRILLDEKGDAKLASFLRFEKGVVGTANPTKGHLLCDLEELDLTRNAFEMHQDFVEDFIYEEQQQLLVHSREPYTLADIETACDHVLDRIDTLLTNVRKDGEISDETLTEVRRRIDEFSLPPTWQGRSHIDEWANRREERFKTIEEVKKLFKGDLDTSFGRDDPRLSPDGDAPKAVYDAALRYQGLN